MARRPVLHPPLRVLHRRPRLSTRRVGGRESPLEVYTGSLPFGILFVFWEIRVSCTPTPIPIHLSSRPSLYTRQYIRDIPWCRSLIAIVTRTALSFPYVLSLSHLSFPEDFIAHFPTHIQCPHTYLLRFHFIVEFYLGLYMYPLIPHVSLVDMQLFRWSIHYTS